MCMVPALVAAELGAAPTPTPTPTTPELPLLSRRQLEDILFDTCTDCQRFQREDMSCIPQGVLAARAVSANNAKKMEDVRTDFDAFEHPPLKYNSKLMNSIWGLYNRYSVHNFKKNTDGEASAIHYGSQKQIFMTSAAMAPFNGALVDSFCLH